MGRPRATWFQVVEAVEGVRVARRHRRTASTLLALGCTGLVTACSLPGGTAPSSGSTSGSTSALAAPAPAPSSAATGTQPAGSGTDTQAAAQAEDPTAASGSTTATPTLAAAGSASGATPSTPSAALPAGVPGSLRGRTVVIDPGHNGNNFRHSAQINAKVDIGNGTKACDTTGTETDAGYSEAAFTFDVSTRLAALLRAQGATVVLTRTDNQGVGPCIDQRAAAGNRAHADAAISVHGDGAAATGSGFHVIVPHGIGSNDAIVAPSRRLGTQVRDAFRAGTGENLSTYTGTRTGGLVARDDLGGLNLSQVPKVFIECGNMRNAADARRMTSAAWRQRAAAALAAGISRFLTGT